MRWLAAASVLFCVGFGPRIAAQAQSPDSTYTSTAPKDCRVFAAGTSVDDSTTRLCPGRAGLMVLDEIARDFKCGKDEVKAAGASGRAVELALRR